MLISVLERPRKGIHSSKTKKILLLNCDECNESFERRWQKETFERHDHYCSHTCMISWRSKNPNWRDNVAIATKNAMQRPDVRQRFELGIKNRDLNPHWRKRMSIAALEKFCKRPELAKNHSERIKNLFQDPDFREQHRKRCRQRINPWWKPWMEKNIQGVHWANKITIMFDKRCAVCESRENICAHHIAPKAAHPELEFDLNNGIALCHFCHIGKNNINNVHKLLRENRNMYNKLMVSLLEKRVL